MPHVAIPDWNAMGLLPPINPQSPTTFDRSPYPVRLLDLVMRFGSSPERRRILRGLLAYRSALHRLGINNGFQWLDGSFTEDVETLEKRPPGDIDVVSFLDIPSGFEPQGDDFTIFDQPAAKARFHVDAYVVAMNELPNQQLVTYSAYWYSMWSHRRNQAWKGFLRVDLVCTDDAQALQWLSQFDADEVPA